MSYKLGSLFDGSGGFPLAGFLCGIEPIWAAEVEPYPIAVTSSRFPNMKHLGDITKVDGAKIDPVDIITFGSPCQDLSVAGKRAGLKHEENGDDETTRSGLFMEAVRIIKEMRKATNDRCPRFAVWENVPEAFSSNDGVVISQPVHTITTGSFTQVEEELSPTLTARDYKDPTCVCYPIPQEIHEFVEENNADAPHQQDLLQTTDDVARTIACGTHASGSHLTKTIINHGTHYIVRRLTPTECARLQGFPDKWGHIKPKTELTDEEYKFWLEVRKTHDAINGRAVKDYNEKQMLTYYNKLWADSAEYKMWGNGIALPCAFYVLQGINAALVEERSARSKWLDDLLRG